MKTMKIKATFLYNGYYYGYKSFKSGKEYYKLKNAIYGNTEKCTEEEYYKIEEEYKKHKGLII